MEKGLDQEDPVTEVESLKLCILVISKTHLARAAPGEVNRWEIQG
jgi:hypothetical protein